MTHYYHLTPVSANAKTGPIAVSTSSRSTCPDTCPFKGAGCYAETGPLAMHWNTVGTPLGEAREGSTRQGRGLTAEQFGEALLMLPRCTALRLNQAGDLPHVEGVIDPDELQPVIRAIKSRGLRAFTYTHHTSAGGVIGTLNQYHAQDLNNQGLTVNASTETIEQADALVKANPGLPVVVTITEEQQEQAQNKRTIQTPDGNTVVICPAQTVEGMTCSNCMLCAKKDRNSIVGFVVHGTAKAKARRVIELKQSKG